MDINEYLDLFLEESREHLQNLNEGLLKIEQEPDDEEAINEIFRAAHTLKGMAATMGYEKIAELTHKMENVLSKIREHELVISPVLSDLLFKCVDVLEAMVENIANGNTQEFDITDLVHKLGAYERGEKLELEVDIPQENNLEKDEIEFNEFENNLINSAQQKNFNTYKINIGIAPGCVMKAVRAFMVFRNLEDIGEIIKSVPTAQELEDENFDNEFIVFLLTERQKEEVKNVLKQISEIIVNEITPINALDSNTVQTEAKIVENTESQAPKKQNGNEKTKTLQTVRVDIGKLDNLMNLVGELVINKTRLEQIFRTNDVTALNETVEQIDRITSDLQGVVMNVRMVPIEQVFNRFPRMVRDLSKELGKDIKLSMEGKETELDRTVIDEIGDPLVHIIRNAIDHGIENPEIRKNNGKDPVGNLNLIARQEGNSVVIIVQDDGQGVNIERIKAKALERGVVTEKELETMDQNSISNLIFSAGFSTADKITDVSGRGVGLDVVKSKIQALNGSVSLESKNSEGSKFIIKLPLTLAIIQALLVKVKEEIYAIPLANIDETTIIDDKSIKNVQGQEVMVLRGKVLPLMRLAKILDVPGDDNQVDEELYVVVVRKGEQQFGLVVNELIGQQEIVITSLGNLLLGIPGIAGAAILGDGKVSLILDVGTLF